ncbi:tetratricopeptide repeat protein [Streptomyces sp. NPDC005263]|uniref:tetratricopeptide repeat protein n=1 Tax=Streptomyces sp. NPDC005263 TaxID=3364711 RepID=UPI0036AC1AE9
MARPDKHRHETGEATGKITLSGTGDATARSGGSAVSGYLGPAQGAGGDVGGPTFVSQTGRTTASGSAVANSGYIGALSMQQRAPQEPAPRPHQVGVIPRLARSFQNRAGADQLKQTVDNGGTGVLTQMLTGMGGVGKTQLAAHYARTAWQDTSETGALDVLVWVTASSRQAIVSAYGQAGVELCRGDPNDSEKAAASFLAWLTPKAGAARCRWLIVLDDVADPTDLDDLWPPASPQGRTLVTTRRRDAALASNGSRMIEVGQFSEEEALAYLIDAMPGHEEAGAELRALADDLGHLPLALAQAAAYMADSGHDVAGYRGLLADRATKLTEITPDTLPDSQAIPLAAVWSLSIDRADTLRPGGLAGPMLALTAMMDSNGIPENVLTSEPALRYLGDRRAAATGASGASEGRTRWPWGRRRRQGQPVPVTAKEAVEALRALHRLSLVDHTRGGSARIHQLLQRAIRDRVSVDGHARLAHTAADALVAAWPAAEHDQQEAARLRACTLALEYRDSTSALWVPQGHDVLFRCGLSLGAAGQFTAAGEYFARLERTAVASLGSSHPQALAARANHARCRGRAGDVTGAKRAFEELVPMAVRALGSDDPVALSIRAGLAFWQGQSGDVEEAARTLQELLPDMVHVLGHCDADTLVIRHEIARRRGQAGDAAGAVEEFRELLADMVCLTDHNDPHFLNALHNLGVWQGRAGDPAEAVRELEGLLPRQTRALGAEHPDTLTTRHELAWARGEIGEVATAAAELERVLSDRARVLGPEHPDTLTTRFAISHWQGEAGDAAGAATALAGLIPLMVKVLGADHPETSTARLTHGRLLGQAGDAVAAVDVLRALRCDQDASHGPEHRETVVTRAEIVHWTAHAGDPVIGVEGFTELLPVYERVFGPDHGETLTIRTNLAHWQQETEDANGAIAALEVLLPHQVRVLGEDHPDCLATRANLAYWHGQAGDATSAARIYDQVLPDLIRVLGPEHPFALTARLDSVHWRRRADSDGNGAVTQ